MDGAPPLRDHGGRLALFGAVGVFNTASDFAGFTIAVFAGAAPAIANIIAFAAANPLSYLINSRVTFRRRGKPALLSLAGYSKFLAAHLLSLAISTAVVFFLAAKTGPLAAKAAAVAITLFINYFASAFFAFPQADTTKPERSESA